MSSLALTDEAIDPSCWYLHNPRPVGPVVNRPVVYRAHPKNRPILCRRQRSGFPTRSPVGRSENLEEHVVDVGKDLDLDPAAVLVEPRFSQARY